MSTSTQASAAIVSPCIPLQAAAFQPPLGPFIELWLTVMPAAAGFNHQIVLIQAQGANGYVLLCPPERYLPGGIIHLQSKRSRICDPRGNVTYSLAMADADLFLILQYMLGEIGAISVARVSDQSARVRVKKGLDIRQIEHALREAYAHAAPGCQLIFKILGPPDPS